MIFCENDDTFYSDLESVLDAQDDPSKYSELRLVQCVIDSPRVFEMSEFLIDYLPEECDDVDSEEIDAIVNEWIKNNAPKAWLPGKFRIKLDAEAAR